MTIELLTESDRQKLPILAGIGLGGYRLGSNIREYPESEKTKACENGVRLAYCLGNSVLLQFSQCGEIYGINALAGYSGSLLGKFYIGQPIKKVLEDVEWSFSEVEGGFINGNVVDVVIFPSIEDSNIEEILAKRNELVVEEICVSRIE